MYGLPRPQYQKIPLVDFFQFLVEVFFEGGFEFGFEFVVGGEGKAGGCELVVYEFDMLQKGLDVEFGVDCEVVVEGGQVDAVGDGDFVDFGQFVVATSEGINR